MAEMQRTAREQAARERAAAQVKAAAQAEAEAAAARVRGLPPELLRDAESARASREASAASREARMGQLAAASAAADAEFVEIYTEGWQHPLQCVLMDVSALYSCRCSRKCYQQR